MPGLFFYYKNRRSCVHWCACPCMYIKQLQVRSCYLFENWTENSVMYQIHHYLSVPDRKLCLIVTSGQLEPGLCHRDGYALYTCIVLWK